MISPKDIHQWRLALERIWKRGMWKFYKYQRPPDELARTRATKNIKLSV